jgi:hypothetical protein
MGIRRHVRRHLKVVKIMPDKSTSGSRSERTVDLSRSGEFRKGAQVVDASELPEGYIPPSGSLTPPDDPIPPPSNGGTDD